jgi:ribonuclease P protein component
MFTKSTRVDKKLAKEVFRDGKFINSPNLTLKFINIKSFSLPRISFIVPKIVSSKAVIRNLLKRRGYTTFKKYLNKLPAGFVGVFIFGKKSMEVFGGRKNKSKNPVENLEKEIKIILKKL